MFLLAIGSRLTGIMSNVCNSILNSVVLYIHKISFRKLSN
jgi:hypothetical protein